MGGTKRKVQVRGRRFLLVGTTGDAIDVRRVSLLPRQWTVLETVQEVESHIEENVAIGASVEVLEVEAVRTFNVEVVSEPTVQWDPMLPDDLP